MWRPCWACRTAGHRSGCADRPEPRSGDVARTRSFLVRLLAGDLLGLDLEPVENLNRLPLVVRVSGNVPQAGESDLRVLLPGRLRDLKGRRDQEPGGRDPLSVLRQTVHDKPVGRLLAGDERPTADPKVADRSGPADTADPGRREHEARRLGGARWRRIQVR